MYKLLLCLRYLRTRYIALASIVSVMLGVATMIVVNSVMSGFSSEMRDRIHGILADVIIDSHTLDGQADADYYMKLARQVAGDQIEAMTATVEVYGLLSFEYVNEPINRPVTIVGIHPESKAQVGPLKDQLESFAGVKIGNEVKEPPQRSRDETPGWELTPEALAYRREMVARRQLFFNSYDNRSVPGDESSARDNGWTPFDDDVSQNTTPSESTTIGPQPAIIQAGATADADADQNQVKTADGTAPTADPWELFDQGDATAEATVDPTALMPGRIYIGSGLIEFMVDDPETGEPKTIKMVRTGDDVKISTVTAGRPPATTHFPATIVDVFRSGMSEYDQNLVFCNLEFLQEMRGMIDPQTGKGRFTTIQIKLKDYADSDEVVEKLRSVFPPGMFEVGTWEQKQGPLLAAVDIESAILNILLFLIITVAGFGILAIFFMIVVEKTRDIGILKALGASSNGVMSIFLSYGLALGIVGSGVGVVLGLLFVHYINKIEEFFTWLTGRKVFDERIYYFPEIPTEVNPMMVLWVAFGAMTIAVLASILPARRAARLHPVEALRYE